MASKSKIPSPPPPKAEDQLTEQQQLQLNEIWKFLKTPENLQDDEPWPDIPYSLIPYLKPRFNQDAGQIPASLHYVLQEDLRTMKTALERSDHIRFYIGDTEIRSLHKFWINTIVKILTVFCNMKRPRTAGTYTTAIIKCLDGQMDDVEEEITAYPKRVIPMTKTEPGPSSISEFPFNNKTFKVYSPGKQPETQERKDTWKKDTKNENEDTGKKDKSSSSQDLSNSIRIISSIFPIAERPTGEETEPFMHKLQPVIDQLKASKIDEQYHVTTLFSVLTGTAREVASTLNINQYDLPSFVHALKKELIWDHNIQQRKLNRWNNLTYEEFRQKHDTHHKATTECVNYLKAHYKDLPEYMKNDPSLLERLRRIFHGQEWCHSLFEKAEAGMTSTQFAELLKTAASNHDDRTKASSTKSYPVNTEEAGPDKDDALIGAFFSRTPPPPKHRRPFRYQRQRYNRNGYNNYRNNRWNRRGNQRNYPGNYGAKDRMPDSVQKALNGRKRTCWGCNQEGHIFRDCPEKQKYRTRLQTMRNIGSAAIMLLEAAESEPNELLDDMSYYLSTFDIIEENEEEEFDTWIADILDIYDEMNPLSSFYIKPSINELHSAMEELETCYTTQKSQYILCDTGAPRNICSIDWLQKSNWKPVKKYNLPEKFRPFRFAGQEVNALHIACLVCNLTDMSGRKYTLHEVAFVLPPTPIPFLVGLQTSRTLAFNLNLREGNNSHLQITTWKNAMFHLMVTSHVWLKIEPSSITTDKFQWDKLYERAITFDERVNNTLPIFITGSGSTKPPWKKDGWLNKLTEKNVNDLHEKLRHPSPSTLLDLFRSQSEGGKVPHSIKNKILQTSNNCEACAKNALLPRTPKLSIPPPATPNIAVTLDVMHHKIDEKQCHILVMLDCGDRMMRLANLKDETARTAFECYLHRWISIFDAPIYTVVDRGSNLSTTIMKDGLKPYESQLCPIPTEAPWSIGSNERSHAYIHNSIDKICYDTRTEKGNENCRMLSEIEIAWNSIQHANGEMPYLSRFGTLPRFIGTGNDTTLKERIVNMELARMEIEKSRATNILSKAFNSYHRYDRTLREFTPNQIIWFHRREYGWRKGKVVSIEKPTIHVQHKNRIYPTHENRVRPYFEEHYTPPEILEQDNIELPDREIPEFSDDNSDQLDSAIPFGRAPISQLLNHVIIPSRMQEKPYCGISTEDGITLYSADLNNGIIDSDYIKFCFEQEVSNTDVHLTVTEKVMPSKIKPEDKEPFEAAKRDEIDFLLSNEVVKPIPTSKVQENCEIQLLKWILTIKRSFNGDKKSTRHRARLVSESNLSHLRFCLNGSSPTVSTATIRAILSVTGIWDKQLKKKNDRIVIRLRDITKAFLQSKPSERLIYYEPPKEFFDIPEQSLNQVWIAIRQLYGDVEAGRYWHNTFVPWICENILDLKQSMYDPSLLFSPEHHATIALCTDDLLVILPESLEKEEDKIPERFKCRDFQRPPTDFKGMDIKTEDGKIVISQTLYTDSITIPDIPTINKPENVRLLTESEQSTLRSTAGKLAWIATCTSPTSSFHASTALQRDKGENGVKLEVLVEAIKNLQKAKDDKIASISYIPLDYDTLHLRVYADASFQNLEKKHSQMGFLIYLADKNDNANLIHWHSSRAPRRPHSTEQSELMALDAAIRSVENISKIVAQLLKKEIPVVSYIDNDTLWINLMNETVPTLPEIGYRCREALSDERVHSMCLITGISNPADGLTKKKPNSILANSLATNKVVTPPKKVFMLQTCQYRNESWIPTSKVPLPKNHQAKKNKEG